MLRRHGPLLVAVRVCLVHERLCSQGGSITIAIVGHFSMRILKIPCPVRVFHPADRCLQNPSQLCTGCCFPYVRAVRWVPGTVVLAACAPRICVRSCDTAQVHNVKSLWEWGCRPRNRQMNAKKARAVTVQRPTHHQSSSSIKRRRKEESNDIFFIYIISS